MARPIGRERIKVVARGPRQFGDTGEERSKVEVRGCWLEFKSSSEEDGRSNVSTTVVGVWLPVDVQVDDADDLIIWERYPDERYEVDGPVGRWYNRQGKLKAAYIPVSRVK